MSLYQKFIQNERLRRFCVLALIIFVLYLSRSMITTILLTFIFTYLAVRLVHFVQRYMKIPTIVIVLLTYALVVFLIYLAITKYVPVLVNQTTQMINSVVDFIKVHIQIQIKYCNLLINTWKNLTYSLNSRMVLQ